MWLNKTVGIAMIITCLLLNGLVVAGLFVPDKKPPKVAFVNAPAQAAPIVIAPPTISLTATPSSISAGTSTALNWTTTGGVTACTGSGTWTGPKTPFGAESTGRLSQPGNFSYELSCVGGGGTAKAVAVITVGNAIAPPKAASVVTSVSSTGSVYCGGRAPCYGNNDVASHTSSSNCWGYNLDRVINISGFDGGFHVVKSGISSIAISSICGKNLGPALSGQVSAEGQTRNHNPTSKQNADKNMAAYFVGYFDASKP
jgi:hypothetical protein